MLTIVASIVVGSLLAWGLLRRANRRSKELSEWRAENVTSLKSYKERYKISGKRGKSKAPRKTPRKK